MTRLFLRRHVLSRAAAGLLIGHVLLHAQTSIAADTPADRSDAALGAALQSAKPPTLVAEPIVGPVSPGKPLRLGVGASGEAVALTINTAMLRPAFGPLKAPAGRQLLVLGGEWKNVIPMKAAQQQQKPTEYKIPKLGDHLYAVVNGRTVCRLVPTTNNTPGHVPVLNFALARVGDTLRGNMIFSLPAGEPVQSLEVRYYDPEQGGFTLPLIAPASPTPAVATADDKPLYGPQRNDVLAAAAYAFERLPEFDGNPAPPGTEYVRVDIRARSLATTPPTKRGGDPRPTVADWNDATQHVRLLVDNTYVAPAVSATWGDAPRLLPDLPTGGFVTFRVPKDAKSLDVILDFPKAVVNARTIRPATLELFVWGGHPSRADLKPIVPPVVDDLFFVAVTKSETRDAFAGQAAGEGKRFLVVDVTVANTGKADEAFQPREQLKYLTAAGEQVPADAASADGPRSPADPTLVPAGERRSFQIAFRVDAREPALRLAYAGISQGAIVALPGGTGRGSVAGAKAPVNSESTSVAAKPRADEAAVLHAPPPKSALAADKPLAKDGQAFPSRVRAKQSLSPKGLAGVGLKPEQVNAAIDRGAAALWKQRLDDVAARHRTFGDTREDLIATLALVHAKYHTKDAAFDKAVRGLFKSYDPNVWHGTYENGLMCMALEAFGDTAFVPQLAKGAQWLIDQQGPEGTWNYGKRYAADDVASTGPRKVLSVVGGRPPGDTTGGTRPLERRTAAIDYTDGDNSTSQYALLGLHSASRSGFKLPRDAFTAMLAQTRERQSDNGSWGYTTGSGYGSMTAAGICAVALTRHELGEKEPWNDQSIERGLAWLNAYFQVDDHPLSPHTWVYYYLYSVERVGRILDTEFIGEHEWYPLGARFLIDHQRPEGLWYTDVGNESKNEAEIPTSFALLFLTRATPTLGERAAPTGPGKLATSATLPPGNRLYVILDCSGSMLDTMDGREKFEIAKDAVRGLIKDMPDNSEVALRAYGYRLRAIQPGASEDSKLLVPLKTLDRTEMAGFIDGLRARGKTPMAFSLDEAARDVQSAATAEKPITVVLLTDGGEDSQPRKDPIKAAAAFGKIPNVSLRVVGFDINRDDWNQQLTAMASAAGGQYLPAAQGKQLQTEMRSAVFGIPENAAVTDEAGKPAGTVQFGQTLTLNPGRYTFTTTFAGQAFEEAFYVSPGATTSITFDSAAIAAAANATRSAEAEAAKPPELMKPADDATPVKPISAFCKNCKLPLKPGAKFCTRCGTKVGS